MVASMESSSLFFVHNRGLLCIVASFIAFIVLSINLSILFHPYSPRPLYVDSITIFSFHKLPEPQTNTNSTPTGLIVEKNSSSTPNGYFSELAPQPSVIKVISELKTVSKQVNVQNKSFIQEHNATKEDGKVNIVEEKCDIFDGKWVYDTNYPIYKAHQCPFLSDQVSCLKNGRPDSLYEHWRWQPHKCDIPRFNGNYVLEKWRGKRVAIVGDSLNRNMWESLTCMLYSSISTKKHRKKRVEVRSESQYKIFRALDYDLTVEFYWAPFLVELKQDQQKNNAMVLRLDHLVGNAMQWRGADVLVFNTGHWWTHTGKIKSWNYFEFNGELMENMELNVAVERASRTWTRWIDRNIDPNKTTAVFRSISPEHKRDNWCYNKSYPLRNDEPYTRLFPKSIIDIIERNIKRMRTPVKYLNITRLSEYRQDAHTNVYTVKGGKLLTLEQRRQPKSYCDCSHWCIPGLPDTWNELLFATLMEY